jgi:hypothetical protein
MNKNQMNFLSPLPLLKFLSSQKFRVVMKQKRRRWSWTSKGRHNFLLQHETREMGVV